MACSHLGPNGQPSILAQQLLDKYQDPALRDRVLSYIHSEDFKAKFSETEIPLDDIAKEPTLEWVERNIVPIMKLSSDGNFDNALNNKLREKLKALYPRIQLNYVDSIQPLDSSEVFNQENNAKINYALKAIDILSSDKAKQVFNKGEKAQWSLEKILTELQIPKEQKQLILATGKTNQESITADLLANYSYTVEINTAKGGYDYTVNDDNFEFEGKSYERTPDDKYLINGEETTFSNYNKARNKAQSLGNKPSQYYASLTVPGGTNYTENEIATPLITPSIKGHAQFSTDKNIGWFRSDEQESNSDKRLTSKQIYEAQEAGLSLEDIRSYGQKSGKSSKIRRILEVQSDLFQKGRYESVLVTSKDVPEIYPEELVDYDTPFQIERKQNQFLQLLNKDNNWVTFFVKSIIQDSAKKGYEKVLFPTGNTASKVEGHTTLEQFRNQKEDRIKFLEDLQSKPIEEGYELELTPQDIKREITHLKEELQRVEKEGFGALKPIYNFYENTVANILKKQGYDNNSITDEYGNTWNEVSINPTRDLSNILLQQANNRIIGQANIKAMTVLIDAVNQKQDTLPHEYAHHYIAWYRDSPLVQEAIKKWGTEEALVQAIGEQAVAQKGDAWNWWNTFIKWLLNKFSTLSDKSREELKNILTDAFLTGTDLTVQPVIYTEKKSLILPKEPTRIKRSERPDREVMKDKLRKAFIDVANANPDIVYTVGYNDLSSRYAEDTGYTVREYAELLAEMWNEVPENLQFSETFKGAISNSPIQISKNLAPLIAEEPVLVNMDNAVIKDQQAKVFIPILDKTGNTIDYFDAVEQDEAFQALLKPIYESVLKADSTTPVNKIFNAVLYNTQKVELHMQKANPALAEKYGNIVRSFAFNDNRPSFAQMLFDNMDKLGYKISERNKGKILQELTINKTLYRAPITDNTFDGTDATEAFQNIADNEVESPFETDIDSNIDRDASRGQGAQDWSDVSFEIDQRDTASTRIKMMMSTIEEQMYGKYEEATSSEGAIDVSSITNVTQLTLSDGIRFTGKLLWHKDPEMLTDIVGYLRSEFETLPLRNSLLVGQLVEFDRLFSNAMSVLADQSVQTIENYITLLKESKNPNLKALANKLDGRTPGKADTKKDEQLRNEFVRVMSKQYNPFLIVSSKPKVDSQGNEFNEVRIYESQRTSQKQQIIDEWKENFKLSEMSVLREDGSRVLNVKEAFEKQLPIVRAYNIVLNKLNDVQPGTQQYNSLVKEVTSLLSQADWDKSTTQEMITDAYGSKTILKSAFKDILGKYGIDLNEAMLENLFGRTMRIKRSANGSVMYNKNGSPITEVVDNMTIMTKGNPKFAGDLARQFQFTKDVMSKPNGLFSAFIMKAAGVSNEQDIEDYNEESGLEQAMIGNPLWTETATMRILAGIVARSTPILHSSTHKSLEGKLISDYSNNTALSKTYQEFKNDFNATVKKYNATNLVSKNGTNSDGSFYLRHWSSNPDDFSRFSLYYMDGLLYGNRDTGIVRNNMSDREQVLMSILAYQNSNRPLGHMISLTHSDKTVTPIFYNVPKMRTGIGNISPLVMGEFKALFNAEHRRIAEQTNITYNDAKYDIGKQYFFFLPQFNKEALEARIGEVLYGTNTRLTMDMINKLWLADGTINPSTLSFKPILEALLLEHINNLTNSTLQYWDRNGITTAMLDRSVVQSLIGSLEKPDADDIEAILEQQEFAMKYAAQDYALNHFLWNANTSMLFFGDPAQVWKPLSRKEFPNATILDDIDSTMKEYAKRLAKDIAPGQDSAWKKDAKYKAITIADVKPVEDYITALGISNSSNGTDAQELVTTQEYLDESFVAGRITKDVYDKATRKIAESSSYYEFTPEELSIIIQPSKPVYAGFRSPIQGAMLYDYIKSSAYPLLPQLTKGLEIDKLRKLMEKNGIARANFASAKKIGAPTVSAELFTKAGKFIDNAQWQSSVQTLERKNLRIQQEVPYDETKEELKIVSQMDKLIVEGLNAIDTTFTFPDGRTFTAPELRVFKEKIRMDMLNNSLSTLMQKFGSQKVGKTWTKPDIARVAEAMITEAKARSYSQNEIDGLRYLLNGKQFEIPLFLQPTAEKFESMIMGEFRKVATPKVPGKSYIQASSVGYVTDNIKTLDKVSTEGITWVGNFDPTVPLRHQQLVDGKVIPAQVIMPFNFFRTNSNGESIKLNVKDFITEGKVDTEKIPKELLQIIAARIPNQGHNSMMAAEIVGFTDDTMGDIIIVPSAITGQMGSDFDVDKLFTYKRPYRYDGAKIEVINQEEGKDRTEDNLATDYFDVHWSVLTNPAMYSKVLNPLDKADLKQMNKKFTVKSKEFSNFYDITSQLKDFQSGKDAKMLVALTSLSVTFNAVIQDKKLLLGNYITTKSGKIIEVLKPIKVRYNSEDLELTQMHGNGTNTFNGEIRTKHDNHTTVQTGAVDNAKDRTLDNININNATYYAVAALHQLQTTPEGNNPGKIVNVDFTSAMLVQQIIWEYVEELKKSNDSISSEYVKNIRDAVYTKLFNKYALILSEDEIKAVDEVELSPENFTKHWKKWQDGSSRGSKEYAMTQLAVLNLFSTLSNYGERLSQLQKTFNQDTNGAGPSILYALQQMENYEGTYAKDLSKIFIGEETIGAQGTNQQGYMFESIVPTALNVVDALFPLSAMQQAIKQVQLQTGKQLREISLKTQRVITRALKSFSVTGTDTFGENPDAERSRLLNGTKSVPSLAIRVQNAKDKLRNNYFLQRLDTNISLLGKGPDFVNYQNAKLVRLDDNKNLSAFMDLLNSPDEQVKVLAQDLIRYTYLLNPQNGPTSFIKHIPTSYLVATKFAEDMRVLMPTLDSKVASTVFESQFFQHNPTQAIQIDNNIFGERITEGQDFPEWFLVNPEEHPELSKDTRDGKFIDYLHFRSKQLGRPILYRLKSHGGYLIYQRIDTLGKGDKTEYNATAKSTIRSIFPENRALQEWTPTITPAQALTNQVDKLIQRSENKFNAYANWGMPTDHPANINEVNRVLEGVMEDRTLPEYFRTVARVLGSTSQTQQEIDAISALFGINSSLQVVIDPEATNLGEYFPMQRKLVLKPITNKTQAAETLLHELSHQRTSAIANASGYIPDKIQDTWSNETKAEYNRLVKQYKAKNPEIVDKVQQLDRVRYDALKAFTEYIENERLSIEQLQADISKGDITTRNHEILYGLSNLQEFIAHVWTNKAVMQFLNTAENPRAKSWISKVWDLLLDILTKVGDFIGSKVNKDSLLREAFELTLQLNNLSLTEELADTVKLGEVVPTSMVVLSETKADQIRDLIQTTYNQQVDQANNLTHYLLNISDKRIKRTTEEEISETLQAVLDKMQNQIKQLNKLLGSRVLTEEDQERHTRITEMKKEIEKDIEDMTQQKELMQLSVLGTKQLEWVGNILQKSKPNVHETILAVNLLNMWQDLDKTVYSKDLTSVNEAFSTMINNIRGKAAMMHGKILQYGEQALLDLAKQRNIGLTLEDLRFNLKSSNWGKSMFVTLGRDANALIQLMTEVVGNAANNAQEEIARHRNHVNKLEKMIEDVASSKKSTSKVWDKFIQNIYTTDSNDPSTPLEVSKNGTWGLVQLFSANWYKYKSEQLYNLKNIISAINHSIERGTPESVSRKKKAIKQFWVDMSSKSAVVRINKILDPLTGVKLEGEQFNAERNRLIQLTGSEEAVDNAIDRTITNFSKYLDEKDRAMQMIDSMDISDTTLDELELTSEQKGTLTEEEQVKALNELRIQKLEAMKEMRKVQWINHNSPISFLQTLSNEVADSKLSHNLEYIPEFIPLASKEMYDPAYAEIQSNEKLKAIYDELLKMSEEFRSYLSPAKQKSMHDNFLPVVTQKEMSEFFGMLGKLNANEIGKYAFARISVTKQQREKQDSNEIPIDFIHRGNKEITDLERNLPKIFELFGNMAIHYKNMQPVQHTIETVEMLVNNLSIERMEGRQQGEALTELTKGINFYKDVLVFKKPKKLELVSNSAVYSINPRKNKQLQQEVADLNKRRDEIIEKSIETGDVDNLRRSSEELADPNSKPTELEVIEMRLAEIEKNARYLAGSKVADILIGINQLKALSFNPFAAVNNLVFGAISTWLHAYGRVDYTPKDLRWAYKKMRGSIGKALTFNATTPGDSLKIHNIMDRVGVITEVVDTMYGKSNLSSEQKSAWLKAMHPYGHQKSGDYLNKGAMVLAMMHKQQVEVTENGEKKTISLYEAIGEDGEWNTEKYGPNPLWSSKEITEQTAWNKFRDKTRRVSLIVHGNQDVNAPLLAKRELLWRIAGQFRLSWFGEGVNTRFGKRYKDAILDRELEGRWRTAWAVDGPIPMVGYFKSMLRQAASIITKADPFSGTTIRHGQELDETDKENMRKNFAGLTMTLAAIALLTAIKSLGPTEEERRRRRRNDKSGIDWNRLAYNMVTRSYQDLMLYNSPGVFDQVTGNLLPAAKVITDAANAMQAILKAVFSNDPEAWTKAGEKSLRATPIVNLIPKIKYMLSRDISSAAR